MSQPQVPQKVEADSGDTRRRRWGVVREVVVLQLKLVLEGVRDVALGPVALVAGLAGIAFGGDRPGRLLRRVLRGGQRFDDWLDLYSALDRDGTGEAPAEPLPRPRHTADDLIASVEEAVQEERLRPPRRAPRA